MLQRRNVGFILVIAAAAITASAFIARSRVSARQETRSLTGWVRTQDGRDVEGTLVTESFEFSVDGKSHRIAMQDLLSFHSAAPASPDEDLHIAAGLTTLAGSDFKAAQAASAELAEIGLPVLTPLLRSFEDTDAHEPDLRYRLFGRILPGYADASDRTLDLVRLVDGQVFRGKLTPVDLKLIDGAGKETTVLGSAVRRLAVLQTSIERAFELHSLHHCTYVGFLDTGVAVRPDSMLRADSAGYVRLSFDEDGWAADPDGIHEPLSGKRKLQEGFRWGAVLCRVGPAGERWFAGKHVENSDLGSGQLYFVVNDNEHWQNNIGSYRVRLTVTNAYDLADPE